MSTVIAALANDPDAEVVARAAVPIAELFDARPLAVHIREDGSELAIAAAERAGIEIRVLSGSPLSGLRAAAEGPETRAVLLGSKAAAGRHPSGATALELMTTAHLPVVVVPPDVTKPERVDRILVPLEGTTEGAAALAETIELARGCEIEVVVLHVLEQERLPGFSDQPHHEVRAWAEEFIARYCPFPLEEVRLELRVGVPSQHIVQVTAESEADMLALGWRQDLAPGRAAVVREALTHCTVPVLLVPSDREADGDPSSATGRAEAGPSREEAAGRQSPPG